MSQFFNDAVMGIAACAIIHIGFGVFGLEPVLEAASVPIRATLGMAPLPV